MAENPFQRAKREGLNLRMALIGPTGSGKTYWGLQLADAMAGNAAPVVIDTENGSARRYADVVEFDVGEMKTFSPGKYVSAMRMAEECGYKAMLIDSLSHAWAGKGGILSKVDQASGSGGNNFGAWRTVTPEHNDLVEALLSCPYHLIVTMRVKTDYAMEKDDRGKTVVRKIGLAPVQRDGLEYEFDIIADVGMDHALTIGKTRCSALDGRVFTPADLPELTSILRAWVNGEKMPVRRDADFTDAPVAAVPVPNDEFTQDDDDPFDEGDQPTQTAIDEAPAGERHSDGAVVKRLMGGFDHCYKPADLKRWQAELAEARQSGAVTETGTALPGMLEAQALAETRCKDAVKIAKALDAAATVDQLDKADALFLAGREGGLFKPGHDVTQSLTCRALKALARVTTEETFETLTDAIGSATDAGNLVEGTDFYAQVMAALAEADVRCGEKVEA